MDYLPAAAAAVPGFTSALGVLDYAESKGFSENAGNPLIRQAELDVNHLLADPFVQYDDGSSSGTMIKAINEQFLVVATDAEIGGWLKFQKGFDFEASGLAHSRLGFWQQVAGNRLRSDALVKAYRNADADGKQLIRRAVASSEVDVTGIDDSARQEKLHAAHQEKKAVFSQAADWVDMAGTQEFHDSILKTLQGPDAPRSVRALASLPP